MRRGTEPVNARSAIKLRRILATSALFAFVAAAVLLALLATVSDPGDTPSTTQLWLLAGACALVAATAAVDLLVIRKKHSPKRERP
ncbi:hypothetical protein [Streptomyces sp. NPDC096095]|uniref:hypothetical protein n=1 Tax=Streptomyces sp. NPDC096095 TaxID=3155545 RepID=UPI003324EF5F